MSIGGERGEEIISLLRQVEVSKSGQRRKATGEGTHLVQVWHDIKADGIGRTNAQITQKFPNGIRIRSEHLLSTIHTYAHM